MSYNACPVCKKLKPAKWEFCYDCHELRKRAAEYQAYMDKSPQQREDDREAYYNRECQNCGKEGANYRKDGSLMCSMCWQIWNSC